MYYNFGFRNEYPTLGELYNKGYPIFNDWWETYVKDYKEVLEQKIIRHYYFYQIGQDTPERFVFQLNEHLSNIMPYYNQLYASELIKIDPMMNHNMEVNGRTIENLLNHVNSTDDSFSKSVRDFTGLVDKSSIGDTGVKANSVTDTNSTESTDYSKGGSEIETTKKNTVGTEDEITVQDNESNTHKVETFGNNVKNAGTVTTDKEVVEKPDEKTVKDMDWGATEKIIENTVGKDVYDATGKKDWTEVIDDDATTYTTTNLTEKTVTSTERDYADTPQTHLNVNADGTTSIRKDYLTNVTWEDSTSQHTADTTQNVVYKDDQTKTHNETTKDDSTTDKTKDVTTDKAKGGIDTETTVHTGNNVTTTHGVENTDMDTTKTGADTTDIHTKEDNVTARDLDTTEKEDETREKGWGESGHSETIGHTNSQTSSTSDTHSVNTGNEKSREQSNIDKSSIVAKKKDTEETTDTGITNITKGFMNVSSSALLEAFRKTFLNIDQMIIDELLNNFLTVF